MVIDIPTHATLADLVARCTEIDRYASALTAVEETRVAALASGVLAMRNVLGLDPIPARILPARHSRIGYWTLTGGAASEAVTPAVARLDGKAALVLDVHGQVKLLTDRAMFGGAWHTVMLWRDGLLGLSSADLMDYLARLARLAHDRAPAAAHALVQRLQAIDETRSVVADGPNLRTPDPS